MSVLQAHLDMVCQKNSDSAHDFSCDPISPDYREGWRWPRKRRWARITALPGVALIWQFWNATTLSTGLSKPAAVDEEAGMGGARGLAPGVLQGSLMLNLDTELGRVLSRLRRRPGCECCTQRPGRAAGKRRRGMATGAEWLAGWSFRCRC